MIFTSYCFPPCLFHRRLASAVPWICQAHLFQGLYPDGCPTWGAFPLDLFMAHSSTSSSFFSNVTLLNKHALADYPNHLPLCSTIPFTLCLLYKLWQSMYLFVVCLPTLDCKCHQSRDLFCLPLCSQCLEWFGTLAGHSLAGEGGGIPEEQVLVRQWGSSQPPAPRGREDRKSVV